MEDAYKTPNASLLSHIAGETPHYKLYKISGIGLATFFGTPLAGGILLAQNFKSLGNAKQAKLSIAYSLLAAAASIAIAFVLPEGASGTGVSVGTLVAMIYISKHLQEETIKHHIEQGGALFSNWQAFGISLLVLLAVLAIAILLAFLVM